MFLQFQPELTQDYIASRHVNRTIDIMRTNRGSVPVRCLRKVAAGDMSVCADAKTVRDKEGRDKRAPTMQDWVNSVNAGFKVAKLLTEVNVYDFFSCGSSGRSRRVLGNSFREVKLVVVVKYERVNCLFIYLPIIN